MVKFFLDRPIFSIVISITLILAGLVCMKQLPVEQFPNLSHVQVLVSTRFPGASAETMSDTVAAPLELAINGIEDMIYMHSQNTSEGLLNLIVSFRIGADPNKALINTQNQVNLALPSLPPEVRKQGVKVGSQFSEILLFIALESKNQLHDNIFLSNYANTNVSNQLERLYGVNEAKVINARDYSMRIWLKPDRLAQFGMIAADVIAAVEEQNGARSIGSIGGNSQTSYSNPLTLPVGAKGRLKDPKEFEEIILRAERDGSLVLLKDVARVELGAQNYDLIGKLNGKTGAFIAIYQDVGTNALEVAKLVREKMDEISQFFPEGITYHIPYDTTDYIQLSIKEVFKTLLEAVLLVSLVIFLFLHSLRISLVPILAMIVSIIGAFIGIYLFGFSINTLTLFGLVLSVGIVVDDAIIVVENIERHMREEGMAVKEAASKAMKEVTGPVIATALVLGAVFIPVSFLGGIPGQFYKQFAITISFSVLISGFVALTLSPALSVILFKTSLKRIKFGELFNALFSKITALYLKGAEWVLKKPLFPSLFCLLVLLAIFGFGMRIPVTLVPKEDQGIFMISSDLPDGASLSRVEKISEQIEKTVIQNPGVSDVLSFSGYSILDSVPRTNIGAFFINLKDWNRRKQSASSIIHTINEQLRNIPESSITAFSPPDIPGVGVFGGFEFWVVNDLDLSYAELNTLVDKIIDKAKQRPEFSHLITSIQANSMRLFIKLDLIKARSLGVHVDQVYQTLQALLGSIYVNQFNKYGHVYQVIAQAEATARENIEDIGNVYVRSNQNQMIPLKSLIIPEFSKGPNLVQRFNGSPAALISIVPNASPEKAISLIEEIAKEILPRGVSYQWGGLAFEEKETGGIHYMAFLGSLILVFLVLAALYERWALPLAILMTVPFGIFGALLAVWLSRGEANIYFQIGIITLIGLSAKNAILIVEFAKEERKKGKEIHEAALQAARLRFRAILMTSLTMIMGALPLVITSGAGAISRKSVGTGIIGGMLSATFLAIFFVPLFYKAMERFSQRRKE